MLQQIGPAPIRSTHLDGLENAGIRHGFFTRQGGVSGGIYRGLNVGRGSDDRAEDVAENRHRVAAWFGVGPDKLITLHQVHSPDVIVVREPPGEERPRADAMVTDRPGLVLGVLTADCGPILFADRKRRVVGAAHAGWRGALGGVLEATIAAMESAGAARSDIVAVLGPSIGPRDYEVGAEFVERFVEGDSANRAFFAPSKRDGHAIFDLPAYTLHRLRAAGVEAHHIARCTYGEEDLFFSYRRSTHRNEKDYGRQISAIMLEGR